MSSRRSRGDGRLYLRGRTWWVQYNFRGKMIRESAHTDKENVAARLLRQRLGEVTRGPLVGPVAERVTLDEMRAVLISDYRLRGNRSLATAEHFAGNLIAHFGERCRALDITSDKVARYAETRQRDGLSNASINRETACLRHMFNLMVKAGRLGRDHVPARPHLEEAPPRSGFLDPAGFAKLRDGLPEYLREPASFLYSVGWRKGAMRSLEWFRDFELEFNPNGSVVGGSMHLQALYAKNKTAQRLPLRGEPLAIIQRAWEARVPERPYVFHRDGQPIGDFRKAWRKDCAAAGVRVVPHDMRRSATRNLVRAGVPERVAMAITGHKTRAMFDRYNIVSEQDLVQAMERTSEYVNMKAAEGPKVIPLPRKVA
jgi:integrase